MSGTFKCNWNIAGHAAEHVKGDEICEIGPAYNKLPSGTTWRNMASEGNEFSIDGGGDAVRLMRYGSSGTYAYKFVDTGGQKLAAHCMNDSFARDPVSGAAKFCQMAVIPAGSAIAIQSVQGNWFPVASCSGVGCIASRSETIGVQSTSTKSKTKDWSQAVMIGIEKQFGVPTAAQTTVTVQSTTTFGGSSQVQDAMQRSSTGTNQLTCGPTPTGRLSTHLYQYRIEVQEQCAERGTCSSTIFTSAVACVPDPPQGPSFRPACQPGCFANDLGTVCQQSPACQQMVHPQFANVQRPASAAQPTPQPAAVQPATPSAQPAAIQPAAPQHQQPAFQQQTAGLDPNDPDVQYYRSQGWPDDEIMMVLQEQRGFDQQGSVGQQDGFGETDQYSGTEQSGFMQTDGQEGFDAYGNPLGDQGYGDGYSEQQGEEIYGQYGYDDQGNPLDQYGDPVYQ